MISESPIRRIRMGKPLCYPHISDDVALHLAKASDRDQYHAAGIVPHIVCTHDEAQSLVDELNKETGEHACTSECPCQMDRPHPSYPKEWCRHLGLIEWSFDNNRPVGVIIPSWHDDILTEWQTQYENSVKENPDAYLPNLPIPIGSFVIGVLEHISMSPSMRIPFDKVTRNKKLYYFVTLTASDNARMHDTKPKKWQNTSIQLLAGKIEVQSDRPKEQSKISPNRQTALNGAVREFHEETLHRFKDDIYTARVLESTRCVEMTQCIRSGSCNMEHKLRTIGPRKKFVCGCKMYRHMFLLPWQCPLAKDLK